MKLSISIGRHSDDEIDLGHERCILSISLAEEGTSRELVFAKRNGPQRKGKQLQAIKLSPGDAVLMIGYNIQENYTHELIKKVMISICKYVHSPSLFHHSYD